MEDKENQNRIKYGLELILVGSVNIIVLTFMNQSIPQYYVRNCFASIIEPEKLGYFIFHVLLNPFSWFLLSALLFILVGSYILTFNRKLTALWKFLFTTAVFCMISGIILFVSLYFFSMTHKWYEIVNHVNLTCRELRPLPVKIVK